MSFARRRYSGRFSYTRTRVSVYLGDLRAAGYSTVVYLYALNASGNVVAQTSTTVESGKGMLPLSISRVEADIDAFEIRARGFTSRIAIDDLEFDDPDVLPVPDFGLVHRRNPLPDGIRQGFDASIEVAIARRNGSSGVIRFELSDLPSGISGTISPTPASGNLITIFLFASPTARPGSSNFTITGTPESAAAGRVPRSLGIPILVAPNFAIEGVTIDVPPCTPAEATLNIYVPSTLTTPGGGIVPARFSGNVNLSLFDFGDALPSGVSLTFSPNSIWLSASTLEAKVNLRVETRSAINGIHSAFVMGTSDPYPAAVATLSLRPVGASIEAFSPAGGEIPHSLQLGTEVAIFGEGICPQSLDAATVEFGNRQASALVLATDTDGRSATVRVPRLATTGRLTFRTAEQSSVSTKDFVVRSYRNTHGFQFKNFDLTGLTYDDLTQVFGKEKTFLTVSIDPCAALSAGFAHCPVLSISTLPHPLGGVVFLLAKAIDAHCFGMGLTAERLRNGKLPYTSFTPTSAHSAWDYLAAGGPYPGLARYLRRASLEQIGSEFSRYYLSRAGNIWASSSTYAAEVPTYRAAIENELRAGRYPLIAVRAKGKGHLMIATDVISGDKPTVAYYVEVYNPNVPFLVSENEGTEHELRQVTNGRITVYTDGRWKQASLNLGPGYFHSQDYSLVVIPFSALPDRPSFPADPEGLLTFVFGSAEITQLSDAQGRTLFAANGQVNTDAGSRLPHVAPFVPLTGTESGLFGYLLGDEGSYTQTVRGNGSTYSAILLGRGMAVSLEDVPTGPGRQDRISLSARGRSFAMDSDGGPRPVRASIVATMIDGSHRPRLWRRVSARAGSPLIWTRIAERWRSGSWGSLARADQPWEDRPGRSALSICN